MFLLLQSAATSPPAWLELVRSPAFVILSLTVCFKFLIAPALTQHIRKELQSELSELAKFPLFVQRLEVTEKAIAVLPDMATAIARIETQVSAIASKEAA